MTDVMSVQAIGMSGDDCFVIEAETEDEAREKLLDLLEKRVWQGWVRPATEDEAKEFEERQYEAYECHEIADRLHQKYAKGL
jgi:SRSO17 transposase